MHHRLPVAAAAALGALLAPAARAGGTIVLDGTRKTHAAFSVSLSTMALGSPTSRSDPLAPSTAECNPAACDTSKVRLTLPPGSVTGRFTVTATIGWTLNARLALYDAKGTERAAADIERNLSGYVIPTAYVLTMQVARLPAGTYTLVVFDNGGAGSLAVSVDYQARPPERPRAHG